MWKVALSTVKGSIVCAFRTDCGARRDHLLDLSSANTVSSTPGLQ